MFELNRNPENYFAEIEQAAFSPSNIVPGIGLSPDKMLQARVFSYVAMRFFRNDTGNPDAYYEPNSFGGPKQDPTVAEPPLRISGDAARCDHREGNDDFSQPRALFLLLDKGRLCSNIADAMQGVPEAIVERQVALFTKVHPDYGTGVRAARGRKSRNHRRFAVTGRRAGRGKGFLRPRGITVVRPRG